MAVLDLFDDRGELAAQFLGEPHAENLADAVGGHEPQADFAASLKDFVDGEVALEDEIAAVLDLGDGVEARQVDLFSFLLGELRPDDQGPVIELLADDGRTEAVGGGLECGYILHSQEGVVVLVEADSGFGQFALDKGVAVEPIAGLEWEEGRHADDDWSQHLVADVEVEMGEPAALMSQDTVVGILRGKLGDRNAKRTALFHALENEIDAIGVPLLQTAESGQDVILLAQTFFRPFDGDTMV